MYTLYSLNPQMSAALIGFAITVPVLVSLFGRSLIRVVMASRP
ncbi:hypothetical protein NSQ91_31850 [Paenibacillus sp. FSL R7-0048]|jgi:hypothetical protein